jgi:uncharacterized protein YhjY with autotransporter beta-barrel domain
MAGAIMSTLFSRKTPNSENSNYQQSSMFNKPIFHKSMLHKPVFNKKHLCFIGIIACTSHASLTQAATANPDSASTLINTSVSIAVLNNDVLSSGASAATTSGVSVCLDPQFFSSACVSNELPFFSATSPENGTLSLNGNTVIYTPNENFVGTDSFTYTVFYPGIRNQFEWDGTSVSITVGSEDVPPPEEPIEEPVEETPLLTPEQQKVSNAIDSLCSGVSEYNPEFPNSPSASSEELATTCAALNSLSAADRADAITTLAADQVTAGYSSTLSMSRNQQANINSRISQLRSNTGGISLQGLSINHYGDRLDGEWLQAAYASLADARFQQVQSSGGSAGNESANNTYTPFGFFINGSITLGDKDSSATERGYDLDADNFTLGMDYRLNDQLVVGAAYGYSSSSIEFNSTGDDMDNQLNNLFLYGSLFEDNYFFSTTLGYSFGEIETSRRILIPGSLDTKAEGTTDSSQLILQFNGSYDITQGALTFGPYAKLDVIEGKIKSYSEKNGGGFEVAFEDQDISSQLLTIGGQAQYALSYDWGVLIPTARFEIKNEFNDSQDAINARFVFDSNNSTFAIDADEIDNLWYVFGTGISAVFPHGLSAYVDFETTTGLDRIDLYTYSFGGRWELLF